MSINSVGYVNSYYQCGAATLSEETRRKLIALGIDPSTVTSEAQAKILIAQLEQTLSVAKPKTDIGCSSEQELITQAKNLAKKIGVVIPQNTPLDEILQLLGAKINNLVQTNGENKQVQDYAAEFERIAQQFTTVKQNENAMFASMNFSANINKMMLGL